MAEPTYAVWKRFDLETRKRVLATEDWVTLSQQQSAPDYCPLGAAFEWRMSPTAEGVADALCHGWDPPELYDAVLDEADAFITDFDSGRITDMAAALGVGDD